MTAAQRSAAASPTQIPVVVIGGGQAGLSISWHLWRRGISHVVLERARAMHEWQDSRWDSFCLVTPNWQCELPGYRYQGPDPDGFMVKAELLDWLAGYRASFPAPVREQTTVTSVRPVEDGTGFAVQTSAGSWLAEQVVVATGGYHRPALPALTHQLPAGLTQLHSSAYRSAAELPEGAVLVVGTGQSGAQIAEDLLLAGREVHLAVGTAPRVARSHRGRDVVAWLQDMGHYDKPVTAQPPEERYRDRTNHYVTGRDGGRDIDLRAFAQRGMALHGHLVSVGSAGQLCFADDLARNLDAADAVYNGINSAIDNWISDQGIEAPPASPYEATWQPPSGPSEVPVNELGAVIWATGFHNDYDWLHASVFDGAGHPQHTRGVTGVRGLYFIGLPWQHTWGSGRFAAVARDAEHVASALAAAHQASAGDAEQPLTGVAAAR